MIAASAPQEIRVLNSPGPIADAFLLSRAFVVIIIGPVGSAKTVAMLRKLRRNAMMQGARVDHLGRKWRKGRVGVIRESYPNVEKNTLPSWFRIHPETDGKFSWRQPFSHTLRLIKEKDRATGQAVDIVDFEAEFRAIGDKSVEEACRGWEVNAVGIDEADLQPPELLSFLSGRVGRFSDLDPTMVVDPQILLSSNMPYMDNWLYKLAIDRELGDLVDPEVRAALGDRPLIEIFIQPSGLSPEAENLHNLPGATKANPKGGRNYYLIQAALNKHKPGYVARMIENRPVPMQHGQPVYGDFRYDEHVTDIGWDRSRKLIVGIDQGLFAAAVATQRGDQDQLRSLFEVVNKSENGDALVKLGPTAFGKMLRAKLFDFCPGIEADQVRFVADPAAFAAADRSDQEHDWLLACQAALGFRIHRAKTNKEALRLEAIRRAQSERGGYAVDRGCKHLIRGHLGGYRYAKADMSGGEQRGHLTIADTIFTHVCDAEQYAALEGEHVIADIRGKSRRRRAGGRVNFGNGYFSGG